jgi:hypothetical protein
MKKRGGQPTHGMYGTPENSAYRTAKNRCVNPRNKDFHLYGGRGIEFRFSSFEEFFADVGLRPSADYSLDRIDSDGHYERGNLRWADSLTQRRNKRVCVGMEKARLIRNSPKRPSEIAAEFGVHINRVSAIRHGRYWNE